LPLPGEAAPREAPPGLRCLVEAYPEHLERAVRDPQQGWCVLWKDGTLMDFDDGRRDKSHQDKLNQPDLEDQMSQAYPLGVETPPPGPDRDPGRIRYEPFFTRMYGASPKEVKQHLTTIRWMPDTVNHRLRVTTVNGVHKALAAISSELDGFDARLRKIAGRTSGPFNWRTIKGTTRLSVHSFAIGLDIGLDDADYWRWVRADEKGRRPYRNRIPLEIVEVFEKHGFIWGGKWFHFDTMHFEYRPELLHPLCAGSPRSP